MASLHGEPSQLRPLILNPQSRAPAAGLVQRSHPQSSIHNPEPRRLARCSGAILNPQSPILNPPVPPLASPLLLLSLMRRLFAFFGIAAICLLVSLLFWKVWEHHDKSLKYQEEPAVVAIPAQSGAVIFAAHPW
ncbi:MAG TPA: hypothetical protein VGF69_05690 [Thermoanaerobaculia bacterium]